MFVCCVIRLSSKLASCLRLIDQIKQLSEANFS
jgi:hypothetical protein